MQQAEDRGQFAPMLVMLGLTLWNARELGLYASASQGLTMWYPPNSVDGAAGRLRWQS